RDAALVAVRVRAGNLRIAPRRLRRDVALDDLRFGPQLRRQIALVDRPGRAHFALLLLGADAGRARHQQTGHDKRWLQHCISSERTNYTLASCGSRHARERRPTVRLKADTTGRRSRRARTSNRKRGGWPRTGRPAGRGAVRRDHGFSASTRWGCSRTGPERDPDAFDLTSVRLKP